MNKRSESSAISNRRISQRTSLPPIDHPIQQIMSRAGSFPTVVAHQLLRKYAKPSSIVLDPFCGKGTTLLAARLLGHSAYGLDVAPEAVICSSAKLLQVTLDRLRRYVRRLALRSPLIAHVPAAVRTFFHPHTLNSILSLRASLVHDLNARNVRTRDNALFTMAALLGILHGHASCSLSIPSAHAYSMAPSYVAQYAKKHRLRRPLRDVKRCLIDKVSRCLTVPLPGPVSSQVVRASALHSSSVFAHLAGKVDLILTSPPYLDAQTYAKDNWLRLWLLGYDYRIIRRDYIETASVKRYIALMTRVLQELARMLKPGGLLICITGDVRMRRLNRRNGRAPVLRTGLLLSRLTSSRAVGLQLEDCYAHHVSSNHRYLHALSRSNGHTSRRLTERILVARKPARHSSLS